MMSKMSKGKVLTVEVSRRSLIQWMFIKSLSGVCAWARGPVPAVLMLLLASCHLLWHWRQMLNVVADVSCVEIPRAAVMEG